MIIDATALPRLIQCGGSRSMPGYTPPGMEQSDDAMEGIAAHWLAMTCLRDNSDPYLMVDRKSPNGVYIDETMADAVRYYLDKLRNRPTQRRFVEQTSSVTYEGITINLRPDFVADDRHHVHIDDFKYGWRIVEPKYNWTMIAYAMWHWFTFGNDIDTLYSFTIHQPRPYHPEGRSRHWTINAMDLRNLVLTAIETLKETPDTLQTGPSCYKCPARLNCPALRNAAMSVLDVTERRVPDALDPAALSAMMDTLTAAQRILNDYKHAIEERIFDAVSNGPGVPNYHIEPTQKPLRWKDGIDANVLRMLVPSGTTVSREKLITPKQAEKLIPATILSDLSERPPGGSKLVRRDDQAHAEKLFGHLKQQEK